MCVHYARMHMSYIGAYWWVAMEIGRAAHYIHIKCGQPRTKLMTDNEDTLIIPSISCQDKSTVST